MMQYAKDAMETNKPWERWEYKKPADKWRCCVFGIQFFTENEYRRKSKTININGFKVPEPMREAPEVGTQCYVVHLGSTDNMQDYIWENDGYDFETLKNGICHLTEEAAKIHAKALVSFTQAK